MNFSSINETIDRALSAAGLQHDSPATGGIRKTIDDALVSAGLMAPRPLAAPPAARARAPERGGRRAPVLELLDSGGRSIDTPDEVRTGTFVTATHTGKLGSLAYKLYVPAGPTGRPRPLIVMLHGCTQDPDDFAAGTRMNAFADRHGFLVAYPEQTARANGGRCWNWFDAAQQDRDGTEPSLIVGIVGDIAERHRIDPARVFVAGLSAGAAMAAILGRAYPEVFAGVAAHSGLPVGAARDMPSAFAAMHGRGSASPAGVGAVVPTIVFHGDADATVTVANGEAIAREAVAAFERAGKPLERVLRVDTPDAGRRCTATEFTDEAGRSLVEEWVVHGGSHAWFGGSPDGTFTDASGPDASAEIVRFFLQR